VFRANKCRDAVSFLFDKLLYAVPGPTLKAARVTLRPPRYSDWRTWAQVRGSSREFLKPWEPEWTKDALTRSAFVRRLRRHREAARDGTGFTFLILRNEDEALIGGVTVSNVRYGVSRACSVGYWMGQPYIRQGYMRASLVLLVRHIFDDLHLHRIEAACLPANTASRNLLRSVGFSEEGYARSYLRIDGRWQDHVLYGLVEGDPVGATLPRR